MIQLLIGVVMFSKKPSDSDTLNSLLEIDFGNFGITPFLYIRDNSQNGFDFGSVLDKFSGNVHIDHDGINRSLSSIYNNLISFPIEREIVLFLDDDSFVNEEYIKKMLIFNNSMYEIAVPTIMHNHNMISPGKIFLVKGIALDRKKLALNAGNFNLVAMMSGTVVKSTIFDVENIKFDNNLTFYGVDTRFFLDCQKIKKSVYVIDYFLRHDSALRSGKADFNEMNNSLTNLMRAQFYIYDKKTACKLLLFCYFPFFIFGKVIKFKNWSFLNLFKNYKFFLRLDDE